MEREFLHHSVMEQELLELLHNVPPGPFLDGTIGLGGHAELFLTHFPKITLYHGFDRDPLAISLSKKRLEPWSDKLRLHDQPFDQIESSLLEGTLFSAALFDLGVSSMQLDDEKRGFGMFHDAVLDMRMDPRQPLSAQEFLQKSSWTTLAAVFHDYGDLPKYLANSLARAISDHRRKEPLTTTKQFYELCRRNLPSRFRSGKIDPATTVFQAVRIHVNDEWGQIERAMDKVIQLLSPGGRVIVISFHSGEDRLIKRHFAAFQRQKWGKILTKKPLQASEKEIFSNRRARSARLRAFEKDGSV